MFEPARANFSPVSMPGMLGTNTPGVSKTYMLGWFAICMQWQQNLECKSLKEPCYIHDTGI